jgi:hypothetical protein
LTTKQGTSHQKTEQNIGQSKHLVYYYGHLPFCRSGEESATGFLLDLKDRAEIYGVKNDDLQVLKFGDQHIDNRINVWISGSEKDFGIISVYFGPNDEKNYTGPFQWYNNIIPYNI